MANNFNILSRGLTFKSTPINSFGKLTTSGAVSHRLIWPVDTFVIPSATGLQMTVTSSSTNDTSGGTGIRTVEIHYLDINLVEQVETVTLAGTTGTTTTATDIRFINCAHALTVGSGGSAAGDILFTNGGTTYSIIKTGELRCTSSARMVPKNKIYYVVGLSGSSISGTAAAGSVIEFTSTIFDNNDFTSQSLFMGLASIGVQDGSQTYTLPIPMAFGEGAVIAMHVTCDKAAIITGAFYGWEETVD